MDTNTLQTQMDRQAMHRKSNKQTVVWLTCTKSQKNADSFWICFLLVVPFRDQRPETKGYVLAWPGNPTLPTSYPHIHVHKKAIVHDLSA